MLFECRVEIGRVDEATVDPPGRDRQPPLVALVLVFLEHEISIVSRIEVSHCWIGLLQSLEETKNRLPVCRKRHLGTEIHVAVAVVRQCAVGVHGRENLEKKNRSTESPRAERVPLPRSVYCIARDRDGQSRPRFQRQPP